MSVGVKSSHRQVAKRIANERFTPAEEWILKRICPITLNRSNIPGQMGLT